MREACFACTTPYQLIGAISITLGKKLDADLFVFGMFPNYEIVCENIRKQGVFQNVYAVDCTEIGCPGREKAFLQMIFAKKVISTFLPKGAVYKSFYSSSRAHPKTLLQYVLLKRNPSMARVIYEDGMGTYSGNSHPLNPTKLKSMAEHVLGWKLDVPENTTIMANIPELVDVPSFLSGLTVKKMPRLQFGDTTGKMLRDVFSVDEDKNINHKAIIFDTLRPNPSCLREVDFDVLDESYRYVSDVFLDDVIVKPHPRSKNKGKYDIEQYKYQEIPMEVLYAGMKDLDQRVLITYTSSAVYTPKILFDKEPPVISLHRLIKDGKSSIIFEPIFEKFKRIYSVQDKVNAPESFDELQSLLESFK